MNRWDIINAFIEKHNYKSYLEIGYYKGWSFDQVKCERKLAVDPNPCKTLLQEKWASHTAYRLPEGGSIAKMTSDEFFALASRQLLLTPIAYLDIIFIDGLHEANQVEKDIHNALKVLSPGGTIVLHDCNPPKYEHTTTGIDGCWTGDVYKTAIKIAQDPNYTFYTVDTDWGVGVLRPVTGMRVNGRTFGESMTKWEFFDKNRQDLLNLISVEEFKTKMNEGITDNNGTT